MFSPLSRGFGTWTGNYDPYNEEGADTDSLPEIDEPHRHGITVGFVSRTPPATAVSPPYKTQHYHGREASFSGGLHPTRENTFSGRRAGSGRDVSPLSRENSDAKMNLPKTYLTRKGALMLFSAPEDEELDSLSHTEPRPRFMRVRKQADLIDTSLKLGTLDKLAMSVLQFGDEELDKEFNRMSDQKKHLFMKFLTKVDERDVDERAQPGGDVRHYLRDLKHKTSLQMGLTGDTALPRSREALELRAILRGLQNDNWPCVYRQDTTDFRKPSALAYQFSRPPSHLDHPPRNHYQRILSSRKLEDSVQSLRSYLGRSLDSEDEGPVPLLTRRRAKYKRGSETERTKYSQVDEDVSRRLRPHMNTPTKGEDLHGDDDEESRDKLGEIIDPRLPRDDRGRIEMIEIPHPTTPRSTEITTEDKVSPRPKSESSSKLGEQIEEEVVPETLVSFQEDVKPEKKKREPIVIPDSIKPKQQTKSQPRKDQKKKGQKVKKEAKTPVKDVTKAMDITSVQPDEQEDEITQIIKKKVQLPPEDEHSVIPDFVSEAIKRSAERSKQQLEIEYKEKEEMISKEIANNLYEGEEGISAEELELAKKALLEKEELTKDKLLKGKQQKRLEEKGRRSGGSSSVRSKKSKGPSKDAMQLEKERIKALKEQEKQSPSAQRLEEIKALEEKIKASNDILSADEKRFKDKLQLDNEVQLELDRIEREAHMAEQTEADVRHALKEDRMKRLEDKAKLKKEEMNRRRLALIEKKQLEKQLKEEARQRESKKIMMLMDDEERKRRQEEQKLKQEEEEKEEEKRRKEEDEELARYEREEEERRRQLEEEIEQEQLKRLQDEQDEIRKQQEAIAAQKEALLEEQRRKRELAALEEQRQREELERKENEEMRRLEDQKARMDELTRLEEEVRDNMRRDMERRKDNAIMRREYNIDAKHNLNKIKHSQSINRAWVWSYFIQWPMESYMRPVGDQEKKKKEAKLREKRKKAR